MTNKMLNSYNQFLFHSFFVCSICWGNWVEEKSTEQRGMEEAPENGKESSHSAQANELMNELIYCCLIRRK